MDVAARARRDRAVITGSAGPDAGKGAVPPRSSRGSGQPVSLTGTEAVYCQLFDSFDRDRGMLQAAGGQEGASIDLLGHDGLLRTS